MFDVIIIGGGIIGLSVGVAVLEKFPHTKLLIVEKETELAQHQTGRNSGVIHSGIYYEPGSFKAKFAKAGNESMRKFCYTHEIEHDICGKLIVATNENEVGMLHKLYNRGLKNGLTIQKITQSELKEKEPYVNGLEAITIPTAGIVDYKQVTYKMAEIITAANGHIEFASEVKSIQKTANEVIIETNEKTFRGKFLINCAGLHSDRIAKLAGFHIPMKIIPFRGEYYKLVPEKRYLVNNLIYPVPNPDFPFLGVHFTRMMIGEVEVGPNAVLAFKREGYYKFDFNMKDFKDVIFYSGFWKLAIPNMRAGWNEVVHSFLKRKYLANVQKLIPSVQIEDLVSADSGVRAQVVNNDGGLVDDFLIINDEKSIHVCNAPSPAATASLEIGKEVVTRIPESLFM